MPSKVSQNLPPFYDQKVKATHMLAMPRTFAQVLKSDVRRPVRAPWQEELRLQCTKVGNVSPPEGLSVFHYASSYSLSEDGRDGHIAG